MKKTVLTAGIISFLIGAALTGYGIYKHTSASDIRNRIQRHLQAQDELLLQSELTKDKDKANTEIIIIELEKEQLFVKVARADLDIFERMRNILFGFGLPLVILGIIMYKYYRRKVSSVNYFNPA